MKDIEKKIIEYPDKQKTYNKLENTFKYFNNLIVKSLQIKN